MLSLALAAKEARADVAEDHTTMEALLARTAPAGVEAPPEHAMFSLRYVDDRLLASPTTLHTLECSARWAYGEALGVQAQRPLDLVDL